MKFNNSSHSDRSEEKVVEIVKLPPSISAYPPKEALEKSKFFGKGKKSKIVINTNVRKSYAQMTSSNVSDILKLKKIILVSQQKGLKIFTGLSIIQIKLSLILK